MKSEVRRGALRIATNYMRLGTTVALGILLVPILWHGVGAEGYGLYSLLGSTVGFAQMFRDISKSSMNRELGAAWHSGDRDRFAATYNSAFVLSIGLACIAAVVFASLLLLIPSLNIPPHLHSAARWVIIGAGVNTFFVVALQAMQNMYMVTERFVAYNLRTMADRLGYTSTAFILFVFPFHITDPARGLTLFGLIGNGVSLVIFLVCVVSIVAVEPSLRPDFSRVSRAAIRSVMGTGGWNIATVTAMNLHIRMDQVIINLFFGVIGNAAFSLAVTLTSYARMLTVGITDGIDAVSARLTSADHPEGAVRHLVKHTTRMTAFVSMPAGVAIFILAHPLLELWTARRVANAAQVIPWAATTVQILMVGMTSRAITENWTRILYGAGFVSRYARQILVGGLLNPVVALFLIAILPGVMVQPSGLPGPYKFFGPAIAFASVFTAVHLLLIPFIGARCLKIRARDLFMPVLPSALIALLCSPILIGAQLLIAHWTLPLLFVVVALYGGLYGLLGMFLIVTPEERHRIVRFVQRRGGPRGPRREAPRPPIDDESAETLPAD